MTKTKENAPLDMEDATLFILKNLDDEDIVNVQNFYCQVTEEENPIFLMSDFDNLMKDNTPSEILESISQSFNIKDKFFILSLIGYQSFNDLDFYVNYDEITKFILEGDHYFCIKNYRVKYLDAFMLYITTYNKDVEFADFVKNQINFDMINEEDWWVLFDNFLDEYQN